MRKVCRYIGVSFIILIFLYMYIPPFPKERALIDPNFKLDPNALIYNSQQPLRIEPWINASDLQLKVRLKAAQHEELIDLLEVFSQLMDKHNITYTMYDGTLLGSYFFHDIIPWDDDIDMMVSWTDRPKLVKLFSDRKFREIYGVCSFQDEIDWYSLETLEGRNPNLQTAEDIAKYSKTTDYKFKFYRESSQKAGNFPWKWPFLDVNFYKEEGGKIVKLFGTFWNHDTVYTKDFLPFHYRPFGRLWLPAPRDTRKCLQEKYKKFTCLSHTWDHIHEKHIYPTKVSCNSIVGVYPHVHRTKVGKTKDGGGVTVRKTEEEEEDGGVIESLMLGEKVLHHTLVYEPWYKASGYFDFN